MADKSAEYQRTTKRALGKDVYPAIGSKPVSEVTPGDVLAICDRIKKRGAPKMPAAAGQYTIEADAANGTTRQQPVNIIAGSVSNLNFGFRTFGNTNGRGRAPSASITNGETT
ncbi:integrase [Burkholderia humptydooensis]|uniref:Integrase n=2 Tax=Burkholderia humptydooensis TaxID=430531 RepID=A0A7U4P710_9BURK|nr:putative phage integrase domain protein [Burkholderia sp. 2002721687]ALX44156.1 integrase [Burkholderia humptydooensis]EIP89450.1 phage integrase family site specific recombinase [Burkholderia humptydooensis MSMB43]QPS43896.1 integrase [Burkholderia humptydooensis]